jgi:pyruvate/oxaloacetate carboxyltransferase
MSKNVHVVGIVVDRHPTPSRGKSVAEKPSAKFGWFFSVWGGRNHAEYEHFLPEVWEFRFVRDCLEQTPMQSLWHGINVVG